MKIKFPAMHAALYLLPVGASITEIGLDRRAIVNMRGELAYYFQGTLKAHDNRLSNPDFQLEGVNWRIEDRFERNADDLHFYDLTLTKVLIPDRWKYSGKELKIELERRDVMKKYDDLTRG